MSLKVAPAGGATTRPYARVNLGRRFPAEVVGVPFKTRRSRQRRGDTCELLEDRRRRSRARARARAGAQGEEEMMKKGARARSGVHLFSFPPFPRSEESPAGGPRARPHLLPLMPCSLRSPPVPLPPGSYEGEGAGDYRPCVRARAPARVPTYQRGNPPGSPLQEYISGIMGNSIERCNAMIYRGRHPPK